MSIPSAESFISELRSEFARTDDLATRLTSLEARVTALETPPPEPVTVGERFGGISEPLERVQGSVSNTTLDRWALEAKNLGVGWLRGDYPLRQVSPTRGTFNYADTDRWVTRAVAQGIKPLPIVYMLPQWMNNSTNDKTPPVNNQDYADWCGVVCRHWQDIGVEWVELWNEQNLSGFWPNPDRVKYVDMFKRAADAIHANSNVKVLIGGLSTADTQVIEQGDRSEGLYNSAEVGCYATLDIYGYLGAFGHADGVGIHPYLDGYRPGTDVMPWCRWAPQSLQRALDICDRWGGQHMSVWNTESAYPSWGDNTEAEKAVRAQMAFEAFNGFAKPIRDRLGPYFWFCLRDRCTNTAQRDCTFGLLDVNWAPMAYEAFTAAQSVLRSPVV